MRPPRPGHIDPILAGVTAVLDYHRERDTLPKLRDSDRLDGRTCLLTGPSAGLGRVLATELARRGARLILACRASHDGLAEQVKRESGNGEVSQRPLDLADLASVAALADALAKDGVRLDLLVSNAGVAPAKNRRTKDGFAELFQVNFLASFLLVHRLIADGTLPTRASGMRDPGRPTPRILITSSESHRLAPAIDFDRFGELPDFSLLSGTTWYGHSKLYVQTFACELGRRLAPHGQADVSVFSYCPGAFRSNISREVGILGKLMTSFFIDPERAMWPAVHCAVSPSLEGASPRYLYLRHYAEPDARASDPANGARLFDLARRALAARGFATRELAIPLLTPETPS